MNLHVQAQQFLARDKAGHRAAGTGRMVQIVELLAGGFHLLCQFGHAVDIAQASVCVGAAHGDIVNGHTLFGQTGNVAFAHLEGAAFRVREGLAVFQIYHVDFRAVDLIQKQIGLEVIRIRRNDSGQIQDRFEPAFGRGPGRLHGVVRLGRAIGDHR